MMKVEFDSLYGYDVACIGLPVWFWWSKCDYFKSKDEVWKKDFFNGFDEDLIRLLCEWRWIETDYLYSKDE